MIYQCADCGATLEGLSYPPMCPFCKKPFDGQGTEQLVEEARVFREEHKFAEMAAKLARAAEAGNTEAAYLYAIALERGEGAFKSRASSTARMSARSLISLSFLAKLSPCKRA